jgi:hypothetical protein
LTIIEDYEKSKKNVNEIENEEDGSLEKKPEENQIEKV